MNLPDRIGQPLGVNNNVCQADGFRFLPLYHDYGLPQLKLGKIFILGKVCGT
jgi:hypothetical protein